MLAVVAAVLFGVATLLALFDEGYVHVFIALGLVVLGLHLADLPILRRRRTGTGT